MRRGWRLAATVAALVIVSGCIPGHSTLRPMALSDWPSLLGRSQQAALERRHSDADQLLADFAQRYPDTPEARETLYWRALYRMDPNNRDAAISTALVSLDAYLRSDASIAHRVEAETLQRLGRTVESLNRAVGSMAGLTITSATPASSATPAANPDRSATELRARDAEIQRLKDELAKANDELERIKRRLTAPSKP